MATIGRTLELILAELVGLRADLAVRNRAPASVDVPSHVVLLDAIAETTRGAAFTVAELLEQAELVADKAADERLRAAIIGALGEINGKSLGHLLRRAENTGLRVARAGKKTRDGIPWRVVTSETAEVIVPTAPNVKRCANGTS